MAETSVQPSSSAVALTARVRALSRLSWGASSVSSSRSAEASSSAGSAAGSDELLAQHLEGDEAVARVLQRLRGALAAEAVDDLAGLPQPQREAGEVGVAAHQREGLDVAGVQQVHRVDDERRVGGVLADGEGVLVDGADGAGVELAGPAAEALGREVAVRALDGRGAVLGELLEQRLRVLGRGVVGVDEHGDPDAAAGVVVHPAHPTEGRPARPAARPSGGGRGGRGRTTAPHRRRTTSHAGRPSTSSTTAKGSNAPTMVASPTATAPSASMPPLKPARKPAPRPPPRAAPPRGAADVDHDRRVARLVGEPGLLALERVELGLPAGELRLDPDDLLEPLGAGEQLLDAPQARLLGPHPHVGVDHLGADVLGRAVRAPQVAHRLEGGHRVAEAPGGHPHDQPGVDRLAVLVGVGLLLGDLAALRVDDPLHVAPGLADVVAGQRDRAVWR